MTTEAITFQVAGDTTAVAFAYQGREIRVDAGEPFTTDEPGLVERLDARADVERVKAPRKSEPAPAPAADVAPPTAGEET